LPPFTIFTLRAFDDVKFALCNTKMLTVVASFLVNVKEHFLHNLYAILRFTLLVAQGDVRLFQPGG